MSIAFVACIETGPLEAQALLLFESIRRYAGAFRDGAMYALSPRAGGAVSASTRRHLEALRVTYVDEVLNTECVEYGSANRVLAAAYVERTFRHDVLVVLDSDTLFLREPTEFALPPDVDIAMRPVDLKGMCTSGPDDVFDAYWRELAACCDSDHERIPWTESFVDRLRIRASYNGGLVVARTHTGLMERWADVFLRSVRRGLRPHADPSGFRAGAGWVEPNVAQWWGSNQAALSLAAWTSTRRVRELSPVYNYPLHLHDRIDSSTRVACFPELVHVHYHWLFGADHVAENPLFGSASPLSSEQRLWLRERTPLRESFADS